LLCPFLMSSPLHACFKMKGAWLHIQKSNHSFKVSLVLPELHLLGCTLWPVMKGLKSADIMC
jgi:hypothetical protein